MGNEVRADAIDRIAQELESQVELMAWCDAVTTGVCINLTTKMCGLVPLLFRMCAKWVRDGAMDKTEEGPCGKVEVLLRPYGPALLINPWNGPTAIGAHKIASALAAGAPCIMKPSEWAPHTCIIIAQAIHRAGLPVGAFQLVCGDRHIGAVLLEDPRIEAISFTGGLLGGRACAAAAHANFKPCQLELGGNNPFIVLEGADVDLAARGVVAAMTTVNGNWCRALGRLLIHVSLEKSLIEKVNEKMAQVKIGPSTDAGSGMGPMVHEGHRDMLLGRIEALLAKGGRVVTQQLHPADSPGFFISPTIVAGCQPEDTLEEMFGPVCVLHTFETEAQAIQLANQARYGLAGYVFGEEEAAWRVSRRLRTGGVKINGVSLLSLSKTAPRCGWYLSGIGAEGHTQSIEFFCGTNVVGVSPM